MSDGMKVVDLTPELREKLAKFAPIPIASRFDYTPKAFRDLPRDKQPVFHLQTLDGITMTRSMDSLWRGDTERVDFTRGEYIVFIAESGVKGWDNYFDVEYKGKRTLAQLPPELLSELCDVIVEKKKLSSEEELGLK